MSNPQCEFCGSNVTSIITNGGYHKTAKGHGPFTLFQCATCGSFGTANRPDAERLAEFYRDYHLFRPAAYVQAAESGALNAQHRGYADRISELIPTHAKAKWIDVGAGHGEIANLLARSRPDASGLAVDITDRPEALDPAVRYRSIDLNADGWASQLGEAFDVVYSIAVLEHVSSPARMMVELADLVAPGGVLVIICPNYGSMMRRVLGSRWPYFNPGEHLFMPTIKGARNALERAAQASGDRCFEQIAAMSILIRYNVRYALSGVGLGSLAAMVPAQLEAAIPVGALLATMRRIG